MLLVYACCDVWDWRDKNFGLQRLSGQSLFEVKSFKEEDCYENNY